MFKVSAYQSRPTPPRRNPAAGSLQSWRCSDCVWSRPRRAPQVRASSAPRATARRSSSRPASSWSAATPTATTDIYERSGGTTTLVSQGRSTATAPSSAELQRRLERRLEGLLRDRRAAGQRRHRQPPRPLRALRGHDDPGLPGPDQRQRRLRRRLHAAPRATARRSSSPLTRSWSAATPTAATTYTSAPGGRRPRSPGARSTATATSTRRPSSGRLQRRLEGLLRHPGTAGQRRHRQLHRRLRALRGDDHPGLPGPDQRQRRLRRLLRGRLERRLEGLLLTDEPLVSGDTDSAYDIYERSGGTTTQVSQGQINGNGAFAAFFAGASSDGSKVFFDTDEQLVSGDTDSSIDVYERSGGTTTRVSQGQINGNGAFGAGFSGASSDGSKVFFSTGEKLVERRHRRRATTSTSAPGGRRPRSPRGRSTATSATRSTSAAPRATAKVFFLTYEPLVSGDTDGNCDVYERSGGTTTRVSQGQINGNGDGLADDAQFSGASSDGTKVFFETRERLVSGDINGHHDVYERSAGTTKLVAVDTSPPNTTISGGPSGATNDPTPDLQPSRPPIPARPSSARSTPGPTLLARRRGRSRTSTDGSHTFSVRARDSSGNLDATPATRTFTVRTAEVKSRARPWWSRRRPGPRTTS